MKVKFVPQNVEFEIKPGESVMHVAQDHGIYIKSVCKGVPSCAECRVRVVEGDHNVLPPGSEEVALIGTGHFIDHRRLSCQLKCFGDISVDMTEQIAKQEGFLSGHKKKQAAMKNDRVEEARAIRSDEFSNENEADAEAVSSENEVREKTKPQRPVPPQRPAGSREQQRPKQKNQPRQQPQQQKPQQQNSQASARPEGSEGGGEESRRKRRRRRGGRGGGGNGGGGGPAPGGGV